MGERELSRASDGVETMKQALKELEDKAQERMTSHSEEMYEELKKWRKQFDCPDGNAMHNLCDGDCDICRSTSKLLAKIEEDAEAGGDDK